MPVLKHPHESIFGGGEANALGQLHRTLIHIVVAHESADKADDDCGGCGWD
jgi:hypothetical protein